MNEHELFLAYVPSPADSRPTASRFTVDLSREAARASGSYPAWDGTVPRVERCLCGGSIEARSPRLVMSAVQSHQATMEHARWRKAEGL